MVSSRIFGCRLHQLWGKKYIYIYIYIYIWFCKFQPKTIKNSQKKYMHIEYVSSFRDWCIFSWRVKPYITLLTNNTHFEYFEHGRLLSSWATQSITHKKCKLLVKIFIFSKIHYMRRRNIYLLLLFILCHAMSGVHKTNEHFFYCLGLITTTLVMLVSVWC